MTTTAENLINCIGLSVQEINSKAKQLIESGYKQILLMYSIMYKGTDENLLEGISGNVKIELVGSVGNSFANFVNDAKIILNGDLGNKSFLGVKNVKSVIYGSCGDSFANGAEKSEFYIYVNCGTDSFNSVKNGCKVVVGGQVGKNFGLKTTDSTFVILNLKGGSTFIGDDENWLDMAESSNIYVRGDCKLTTSKLSIEETNEKDEDIFLPLISEYSRLFVCSLSKIKSEKFYKISLRK